MKCKICQHALRLDDLQANAFLATSRIGPGHVVCWGCQRPYSIGTTKTRSLYCSECELAMTKHFRLPIVLSEIVKSYF